MNSLETFLLDSGLSWTLSKLLPYVVLPIVGLIIWAIFRKSMKRRPVRVLTFLLLVLLPFGLYFIMYPIYEGDFSNNSDEVALVPELKKGGQKLVVITIPDCPFCKESVYRMKAFKERNPDVKIEYRVCSSRKADAKAYKEIAGTSFPVVLAKDLGKMSKLAEEAFPAFVLTDGNSGTRWSNDHFGVAALDEVESRFE
jgi:hypothetical protein